MQNSNEVEPIEKVGANTVNALMSANAINPQVMNSRMHANTTNIPEGWISSNTLRSFSVNYAIARACIDYTKTKVSQLDWAVVPRDDEIKPTDAEKNKIKEIEKFFTQPSGTSSTFRKLQELLIEDYLVIGSIVIEKDRTIGNDLLGLVPIDAATIKVRVDDGGRIPTTGIAFEQWIRGMKTAELEADDVIYEVKNNRTNSPFGLSPLESLIIQVKSALAGELYNYRFFTDSNLAEGFVGLPEEWSQDQIKEFQAYFDALMAGNTRMQRRIKFMPGKVNYTPTKKTTDMEFERFEEWLLKQTCAVFGVPPQDIGFTMDVNRSTGDVQSEKGEERAKRPLAKFLEEVYTKIIAIDMGYPEFKFKFSNVDPSDQLQEAQIDTLRIKAGITSVDEVRQREGLDPIGLGHYVMTGKGPMLIEDINNGKIFESTSGGSMGGEDTLEPEPTVDADAEKAEIKQWKKCAIKDLKMDRGFRKFNATHISDEVYEDINKQLSYVVDRDDISKVFDIYLNGDYDSVLKLRKLSRVLAQNDK